MQICSHGFPGRISINMDYLVIAPYIEQETSIGGCIRFNPFDAYDEDVDRVCCNRNNTRTAQLLPVGFEPPVECIRKLKVVLFANELLQLSPSQIPINTEVRIAAWDVPDAAPLPPSPLPPPPPPALPFEAKVIKEVQGCCASHPYSIIRPVDLLACIHACYTSSKCIQVSHSASSCVLHSSTFTEPYTCGLAFVDAKCYVLA